MSVGIVAFAEAELQLTLTAAQREMLASFDEGGYYQAVWQCGRRGGKSLLSDILALADVALRDGLRSAMRPGELRIAAIVAPRLEQAVAHVERCAQLARTSPLLSDIIVSQTAEELRFANHAAIRAYPCSSRSIRGDAWSSCILDELAHFVDTTDGPAAGDRVLEAAMPALAQFGSQGWLIGISTPRWKQGAFWKLVERAQSGRFASVHYRHLTTRQMNPRIDEAWLDERRREDPEVFAREFEAQFVDGVSSFLSSADVIACVASGRHNLPPRDGIRYVGALDPAYQRDNFAAGIGHFEGDGRVVVDGVWVWYRHGHEATLDEVKALARQYRIRTLRTDQFCAQPVREGLEKRGISPDYQPWTNENKSDAFSWLKRGLNTRSIELPDDPALIEELCGLEQRPTPGGAFRIAAASGHDDRAIVVASIADMLLGRDGISPAAIYGVIRCGCGFAFQWMAGRPCPGCGVPASTASPFPDQDAGEDAADGVPKPQSEAAQPRQRVPDPLAPLFRAPYFRALTARFPTRRQ